MVSEENVQKALERAKLVIYEPDFNEVVYDNPKKMYEDCREYENELTAAIEQLHLAEVEMMTRMIWWDEPSFILNSLGGSIEKRNNAIRELQRLRKNLSFLRVQVRRIIQMHFEDRFTLVERKYGNLTYEEPETGMVFFFDTKAEMIKYLKIEEKDFDEIVPQQLTEKCFPILTNTLRFHGFNFGSDEFRTSWKFETCRHCTQLESGKWAVVINYDC
jgi:hypothetical protein